ncbi:MAG: RES family NAD+ phosphorylase, partial [Ruminiclostridium sp.]
SYLGFGLDLNKVKILNESYRPEFGKIKNEIEKKQHTGFWGYDENESFIPTNPEIISDGRTNPAFIRYLYTAEDPHTALVEVRPYLGSKVSIAEIKINKALKIVNFSHETLTDPYEDMEYLVDIAMNRFSKPSDSNKKDYIATQYIAEYIKSLGYDGIRFDSSLHKTGKNVTIFNYNSCETVSSKLYGIKDIIFETKIIAPFTMNVESVEKWNMLKSSITEEGYNLFQFQYGYQDKEGFNADFVKPGSQFHVITHIEEIQEDILNSNMNKAR